MKIFLLNEKFTLSFESCFRHYTIMAVFVKSSVLEIRKIQIAFSWNLQSHLKIDIEIHIECYDVISSTSGNN